MKAKVIDQFASDAINAPETVTGGSGRRTHRRTRTHRGSDDSLARRTRNRTRTRTGHHG